ncbi:MAG: radical SAM protein [Clostridia bacterium]|nr:radical SAM protein [Clostridia bacterium]
MKTTKREYKYASEHFNEVYHTTLNPEGPGVVRIHLVPPVVKGGEIAASTAIINGQDIIPVNVSWSIMLAEFITEVNKFAGRPITDDDAELIRENTCKAVRKVYPLVSKKRIKRDIYRVMKTFQQIAKGEAPDETIDYITLGEYAPYMRAPHRMDLMVSAMEKDGKWNCNQRCIHCYAAGQEHSSEKELSTEQWKHIIDKCREAGVTQITFTGGEPTIRPDIFELIDYGKWFITRLNTNGILLTKEYCEKLRAASIDSVQITFYSCDEAIHNRLVGAERYSATVAGIENAVEAGLSLSINTPLCTLNRDYVKTLEFLHEKGVIYVTCSGLITTGNAAGEESERLQLTREEISRVLEDAVNYCYANGMEINFTSPGWVDDALCQRLNIPTPSCGACLSNMAITPSGEVVPCQSWLSGKSLGNMLETDFEKIWESEECKARRDFSAEMGGVCPLRKQRPACGCCAGDGENEGEGVKTE